MAGVVLLGRTRAARAVAGELAADANTDSGDLAAAACRAVTVIDDGLDGVVRHLHGCLVLIRAWETKLRHTELAVRTGYALAALPNVFRLGRSARLVVQRGGRAALVR